MIVFESERRVAPLLAPQLLRRGPFEPGERVEIEVPVSNERHDPLEDVRMRFECDAPGARCDPESIDIPLIRGREQKRVRASVLLPTELPAEVTTSTARVWAILDSPVTGRLQTAKAELKIEARPFLQVQHLETALLVRNDGTAPIVVRIEADRPLPETWPETLSLNARDETHLELPAESLGAVRFIDEARSDRRVIVDRRTAPAAPHLSARGEARGAETGVRIGDLVPFEVELLNTGGPAFDVKIDLTVPAGVSLVRGYTTRDDVPILNQDILCRDQHMTITLPCVQTGEHTIVHGAFRIEELSPEVDALAFEGGVECGRDREELRFGTRVVRIPQLAGHGTYWSPLVEDEDGLVHTTLTITNSHGETIVGALALRPIGLQVESVTLDNAALNLGADAVDYGLLADLPPLLSQTRTTLTVVASRLPGAAHVGFDANLVCGGRTIPLAEIDQELLVEPRPIVTLEPLRQPKVRLGAPCSLEVTISNHGTESLRGMRIRPIVPEGVRMKVPVQEMQGEWYVLSYPVHPLGKVGFPVLVELTAPPEHESVQVGIEIDGENAAIVSSRLVELATPSAPALTVSEPEVSEVGTRGLVEVRVRVANRSDGVARDVWISVPADNRPAPYTATLDGMSIDERGQNGSILIEGLALGDLYPNTQRDIAWYAAPAAAKYHTRVTVRAEGGIERTVSGGIEVRDQSWFTTEPAPPQAIEESRPLRGVTAVRSVEVTDHVPEQLTLEASGDGLKALGTSSLPATQSDGSPNAADGHEEVIPPATGAHELEIAKAAPPAVAGIPEPVKPGAGVGLTIEEPKADVGNIVDTLDSIAALAGAVSTHDGQAGLTAAPDAIEAGGGGAAPEVPPQSEELQNSELTPENNVASAGAGANAVAHEEKPGVDEGGAALPVDGTKPDTSAALDVEERADRAAALAASDDFGLGVIAMLREVIPQTLWTRALTQSAVMRLLGPSSLDVLENRRKRLADALPELFAPEMDDTKAEDWVAKLMAEWDSSPLSGAADEAAVQLLTGHKAPERLADPYEQYLEAVEAIYPIDDPDDYASRLRSLTVAHVTDAINRLIGAAAP